MKIAITQRLSFRLARNTVILTLLLGLMMSLMHVTLDFFEEESTFDHEFSAIIDISHAPASQIAYNIDAGLALELLEGLLEHPAIIRAEIVDAEHRVLASQAKPETDSPYRWSSDLLFKSNRSYSAVLEVPQLQNYVLGNLNIVVDTYPRGSKFLQRSALTVLSGFVRSLILSAVLLILFYFTLTEPLVNVIGAVSEVNPETPEKVRLPVPPGHEYDEIGVLVNSTNNHLQSIEGNLEKLRNAEVRLKSYSERLEHIVESRTNELSRKNIQLIKGNHDLRVAKEEALRRAKARADFLANMSHEIRTPFNGVLGMIGLTLEEPLSEKQKEQLSIAHSSGLSLLELLNDILDISKVEAGKLTLENISFSLRNTAEDVCRLMAPNAHAKDVELLSMVNPEYPEQVFGDPTRIRQIISNLISNAIKFTEAGEIDVVITQSEEQYTEIAVRDTGIGIDSQHMESIFSPFSQGDEQITRKFGGTGLGLTLCKQFIKNMGGELRVESEPGKGSTFRVLLPLAPNQDIQAVVVEDKLKNHNYLLIYDQNNKTFDFIANQISQWQLPLRSLKHQNISDLRLTEESIPPHSIVFVDLQSLPALLTARTTFQQPIVLVAVVGATNALSTPELEQVEHLMSTPLARDKLYEILCKVTGTRVLSPEKTEVAPVTITTKDHHILLVEDNSVNQLVARTILNKLGYRVSIANHGKEALDLIHKEAFSIVLMDCHMPVMDGYEATREIRKDSKFDYLPIIAVTANVMQGDKENCIACGMNDYVTKPYAKQLLANKLSYWLAEHHSPATAGIFPG